MKFRYHLESFLFKCFLLCARFLPRSFFVACGSAFGRLAYQIDARHREVGLSNLALAFPELTREQRTQILKSCYAHFSRYLFEMLTFFPTFQADRMRDFEFEGLENLDQAYREGKGAIVFTGHWGAWELMGLAHGFKGYSLGVVARTLDNPYLQQLLETFRRSTGNFVINKKEGFRPMLRALKEGRGIAILMDQNVTTEERIFVDFFGKPASTTPAVGLLHLKTEAALIPAFALPLGNGRYRFSYGKPLDVQLSGDRKVDVARVTQECTRAIEEQIRRYPQFWLWMHRRWKTRPQEGLAGLPVEEKSIS